MGKALMFVALAGNFEQVHRGIFARTAERDLVDWGLLALRAGVTDIAAFARCMADERTARQVERDVRAARRLDAPGAPFLLVNGARSRGVPGYEQLRDVIQELLRLERPRR